MEAMNKMKLGKMKLDMIIASGKFSIGVIKKLYQRVLDGKGISEDWKTNVVVPIFIGKENVMDCGAYKGVKLLEHAMKIVERVLENKIRELVTIQPDMQFGFMPGKGTTHELLNPRRMQEEFRGREKKLYLCFVDLKKAVDRVTKKVTEWKLRKKGLAEVLAQAVMSLREGSRTKIRVGSGTSEEFGVPVGVHQRSLPLPLLLAIVVDVVTEHAKEGLLNEILYVDDMVLVSESLERFQRWSSALEGKGLTVNVGKIKMVVSGTEVGIVLSKTDPCGKCGKKVGSNAVCCTQCAKWIHGRCTKMKKVTCSFARKFVCRRCTDVGNGTEEPVEVFCDEVETVKGFCYLGDKLNASGECEIAVT